MSAVPLIYEYMFIYMTVTWIYMLGLPWWSVVENMYFQHQEAGGWGGQVGAGGGVQSLVGKLISHMLHGQNIYIYNTYLRMEKVWEASGDKGRTVPQWCPCYKTATSKDTQPAPKSFSPTHCLWLESQRISQLHCGSLWFSPRPHSRVQTEENWSRKKILHPNVGTSAGPTICSANSGCCWDWFSMGKKN